jgi:hypothetical protein
MLVSGSTAIPTKTVLFDIIGYLQGIVRPNILMAASMKMSVFWDVAPCNLTVTCCLFRDAYYLHT